MKAIILAAGLGSRLQSHTEKQPKCLVKVDDKSLLDIQIAVFQKLGIDDITVVGGYLSHMLERPGIKLHINENYAETNMVWTLACAKDEIVDDVIISYGDIIYSPHVLKSLLSCEDSIAITVDSNWRSYWEKRFEDPLSDAETLKLDDQNRVLDIGRKPQSFDEIDSQYMGLMRFQDHGINLLHETIKDGINGTKFCGRNIENAYMTDLLQHIVKTNGNITAVPIENAWVEVDTPDDLNHPETLQRTKIITSELNNF